MVQCPLTDLSFPCMCLGPECLRNCVLFTSHHGDTNIYTTVVQLPCFWSVPFCLVPEADAAQFLCNQNIIYGRCFETKIPFLFSTSPCSFDEYLGSFCFVVTAKWGLPHLTLALFVYRFLFLPKNKQTKPSHIPILLFLLPCLHWCAVEPLILFYLTGFSLLPSIFI